MNVDDTLDLLLHGNQLKRTARTGWVQRGVPEAENVAAHSFGVAFVALVLAPFLPTPPDLARLLAMAVLHDLPETLTTDIPSPAWRHLPEGIKTDVERGVMRQLLGEGPWTGDWLDLWEELHAGETMAARLVQDADRLEMLLQAWIYEEQTGNRRLSEFWEGDRPFHFAPSQALYEALRARRAAGGGG